MLKMKKKKIWKYILLGLACVLVITGVILALILPVKYTVDSSLIVKNPDYNVFAEKRDGYTTLVKKDAAGNVLDDEFKVIGFTDTHLDHRKEKGDVTMEYIIRNIVSEKPDLVVFVGDNITSSFNGPRARQLCKIMEKLGVYWTCVLGNHEGDNMWSISRKRMVQVFASYPHCLIEPDVKHTSDGETVWGNGNHVINLADSKGNITRSLFFIDGGADMSEEDMIRYDAEFEDKNHNDYDYVKGSQIKWYQETVADIAKLNASPVPSAVYVHIPLPEYKTAYEELTDETEVSWTNIPEYNVVNENGDYMIMGQRREAICCSGHNSGFFDAIKKAGSTDLVISGHDHINDFVLSYQGVVLSYNVPSGYSSYNLYSKKISDKLIKGFTRYTFRSDGTFGLEQIHNADLYPEAQDAIKKMYD